jgi:hypothetical protein
MRSGWLVVVALVGCTGLHVDDINVEVNDPMVNVDANAKVDVNANVDATANADVDVVDAPDQPVAVINAPEQPATDTAPVRVVEFKAEPNTNIEPSAQAEPVPAAEPEPEIPSCPDEDNDGVCNDVDVCPAGDDTVDADQNGFVDACDQVLWQHQDAPVDINTTALPFVLPYAQLVLATVTGTNSHNETFTRLLTTNESVLNELRPDYLTRAESALRDAQVARAQTSFKYVPAPGADLTKISFSDVAKPVLGTNQHVTRIACIGSANTSGVVQTRWEIRGY